MAQGTGARDGVALAIRHFFLRHRVLLLSVVLSALGLVTGPATMMAYLNGFTPLDTAMLFAGIVLATVIALVHTRHLALALLMGIAPLPGLAWAAPLGADASFGAVPYLAYGFGFAIAVLAADDIVNHALTDEAQHLPLRQILAALGLATALAASWFWRSRFGTAAMQAVADMALETLSVLIVVPFGAFFVHFDESFVARANRVRERRQRLLEFLSFATSPRWGLSLGGIALIFLALFWFDAEPAFAAPHLHETPYLALAALILTFAAAMAAGSGWREAIAAAILSVAVGLATLWGVVFAGQDTPAALAAILIPVGITALAIFFSAARVRAYRKQSDAAARALEKTGTAQFFAVLGALAALLPAAILYRGFAGYALALVFAGVAALLLAPAIATALVALLPEHHSVEELYGRG